MYSMINTRHESPLVPNLPNYLFGERLGSGACGTVYKAKLISTIQSRPNSAASTTRPVSAALPTFYAIKCINRKALKPITRELLCNEIQLLKEIKHKNIVEMYDFQWDENYIYIVMEYCAGGDMSTFIRSRQQLSEDRARPFVQQIAKALKFLYEKNISHMDLKPENILLTSIEKPILKIADFGVAQHIGKDGSRSVRGTLVYMAPEILSSHPYDNRVDLWSIGVIFYECLFGKPPFSFQTIDELIYKIQSDIPIEIPIDAKISMDCRNLLDGLLQRDPNKRINFPDFFRHPFIQVDLTLQIIHADEILQKSINYEQLGDFKKSLDYRVKALDEYVAIIKIDEDDEQRKMLRMKVKQGLMTAEALKKRIRETTINSSLTSPVTTSVSPSIPNNDNLDLTNNDKELVDAYQHCLNGNQLMNAFVFAQACEEYETGITVMLRVAPTETDPEKKKILYNVISHYLNKFESCKQRNDAQRLDLAIEKIKEDTAINPTVLDESINEEKKQQSSLQQTCHLQ